MDAKNLTLKRRNGVKVSCVNEIERVKASCAQSPQCDDQSLHEHLGKLKDYRDRLTTLHNEILVQLESEQDVDDEITNFEEHDDILLSYISKLQARLKSPRVSTQNFDSSQNSFGETSFSGNKYTNVKLPKIDIAKFDGNPLKWEEFWDSFESTIHNCPGLSDIEKFKYLKSFLTGDISGVYEGYRLTSANYSEVVASLKDRYGNTQVIIFSHFEALLALTPATYDISQLQTVYDSCERHVRSLVALGLEEETFGQVFTPIILSKLPMYVKMEIHRKNGSAPWTLGNLRSLLKDEIRAREFSHRTFGGHNTTKSDTSQGQKSASSQDRPKNKNSGGTSSSLLGSSSTTQNPRCSLCNEDHYTDRCNEYSDAESRREKLKGRCFVCLSSKHKTKACTVKHPCAHCKNPGHHRSLCDIKFGTKSSAAKQPQQSNSSMLQSEECETGGSNSNINASLAHGEKAILQTALANLQGCAGSPQKARLLFDTGCSRTFITTKLCSKLKTKAKGTENVSLAGFADKKRRSMTYKVVECDVLLPDGSKMSLTMNVTPHISCPVQKYALSTQKYPVIKQLKLAEPLVETDEMVQIDILIGNDYYYDFIGTERIQCPDGLIFLSSSLGFIATGRIKETCDKNKTVTTMLCGMQPQTEHLWHERFWNIEDIGVKSTELDNDDEVALQQFNKSIAFKKDRYYVSWPWKKEAGDLPENKMLALGRLKSLMKRLCDKPDIATKYNETIQNQLKLGIIEEAPAVPNSNRVHYIPHHCVVKDGHATTKLRIVYDASAKLNKTSFSLNDCLFRGPVMLEDSCGILLRFRLHKIGLIGDIEKAFLQVGLHETDRDVTRFFWVKDVSKPAEGSNIITFRFRRVPFGAKPSPFLLAGTVLHHINHSEENTGKLKIEAENPNFNVGEMIRDNHYVDNIFGGVDNKQDGFLFYKGTKELFDKASMNVREWSTNSPELLSQIAEKDRANTEAPKVLGLKWNLSQDTFYCIGPSDGSTANTKRTMLSSLAQTFDPCGYFSPVTVAGKLIIQQLWKENYGWDEKLPVDVQTKWQSCVTSLQKIPTLGIDRWIGYSPGSTGDCQLHAFCDASANAFAAVVYLRHEVGGVVNTCLLFAKSRVAPLKSITIPRLELLAALIAARILKFVKNHIKIEISRCVIWSDSQCTLQWILGKPVSTRFVKNRVDEIRKDSAVEFRYVNTHENPADLSSRGCSFEAIENNTLWWYGPVWLQRPKEDWPNVVLQSKAISVDSKTDDKPSEKLFETVCLNNETDTQEHPDLLLRFSTLTRLIRVTAWIKRFLNNCSNKPKRTGSISVDELDESKLVWEKYAQKQLNKLFPRNQNDIIQRKIGAANVFVDERGIIRCCSRMKNAEIPDDAKYPKVLPKNHPYTTLVIADCHNRLYHSGLQHTLAQTRYEYWVIRGRSQVKRVVNKCRICALAKSQTFRAPPFPPLPDFRTKQCRPFSAVGIDCMGPLWIKQSNENGHNNEKKVWICLFCCAVIRGIHLEVMTDMSTDEFLLAFRRFAALYGTPNLVISDNAKQFHASDRFLRKQWLHTQKNESTQNFLTSEGIEWKFVTELAPWMGGMYERMVGLVKKHIKIVLDKRFIMLAELQTIVTEVAAIVNNRPLVYVEAEVSEPLTPAHFLGRSRRLLPNFTRLNTADYQTPTADSLVIRWKRIQAMLNEFWKAWQSQYLISLRQNNKHSVKNTIDILPKVGMVVQIRDKLPRNQWKLGVIDTLKISKDGHCRTVNVRLPNKKLITRPVRLLSPLETSQNPELFDAVTKNTISKPLEPASIGTTKYSAPNIDSSDSE